MYYALTDSVDTLTGLNSSTMYYFSLMVRDTADNWSDTASSAQAAGLTLNTNFPAALTLDQVQSQNDTISDTVTIDYTFTDADNDFQKIGEFSYQLPGVP